MIYRIFLFILIIAATPLMAFAAILIALVDGFPVFYRQKRVGLGGTAFTMYKFRTMARWADALQKKYARQNEADGPVFKIREDPRFTRTGRFLSHTGLDELPQLINVLCSEMALFGPRPLPVAEAAKLTKQQQERHRIMPGIISPWIFEGYHSRPFDEWMKSDIAYANKKSLWYDLGLFGKAMVFMGKLFMREMESILPINKYYQ